MSLVMEWISILTLAGSWIFRDSEGAAPVRDSGICP